MRTGYRCRDLLESLLEILGRPMSDEELSPAETKRRAEAALKKMLATPPVPRTAKKKPSPKKRKGKTDKQAQPTQHARTVNLTPSELASLKREAKETSAYAQKAFSHLRPKAE